MSEAEVGIAMGTGTDVAMHSAGITLVTAAASAPRTTIPLGSTTSSGRSVALAAGTVVSKKNSGNQ